MMSDADRCGCESLWCTMFVHLAWMNGGAYESLDVDDDQCLRFS